MNIKVAVERAKADEWRQAFIDMRDQRDELRKQVAELRQQLVNAEHERTAIRRDRDHWRELEHRASRALAKLESDIGAEPTC